MEFRELAVPHAWEITPVSHGDDRGFFMEAYRGDLLAEVTGRAFELKQGNVSRSVRGVVRGIHWADLPAGQAKYFTVTSGSVVDFVVDIRVGSPTYGRSEAVELDDRNRKAVFLSEGLGHLFVVTSETAEVSYLVNELFNPPREHALNALDPAVGLALPLGRGDLILSPKDAAAPTLDEARQSGLLPTWEASLATYEARSAAATSSIS